MDALRAAKGISRELRDILAQLEAGVNVNPIGPRGVRRSGRANMPVQGPAKQKRKQKVQEIVPEEFEQEDFGDIDLGGREQERPEDLFYRDQLAHIRGIFARENEPGFLDLWAAERERPYEEYGLSDDQIKNQLDQLFQNFPELRQKIERANDQLREREREREEEAANQRFQRRRAPFARLEQSIGVMPRHNWLDAAVRVVNTNPFDPELVADMPRLQAQLPAIEYAQKLDEYEGPHIKVQPRIADWKRCQRCAWFTDDGQCKRYASCHRPYPSNTYCWEHAKEGLPDLNPYTRRLGLI